MFLRRLPIILVAAAMMAGGILRIWGAGRDGYLLAGAALVLVGLWVGLEAKDDGEPREKDEGSE